MTEPTTPLSDEDLSAALDGMAGPDVVARIQADPSAQARLAALQAASETIGQAPTPGLDPAAIDALVAHAIEHGTAPEAATDGVVTPLAPRRRTSAGAQRWLVAAAVVALVAIGLGFVYAGTHSTESQDVAVAVQDDQTAAQGGSSDAPSGDANAEFSEDAAEAPPDHGSPEAPTGAEPDPDIPLDPDVGDSSKTPAELVQLGSFADKDALRTELASGFPPDTPIVEGTRPTEANVTRCNGFVQTVLGNQSLSSEPDAVGLTTVAGKPYLVYDYTINGAAEDGSQLITATDPDSCDLLVTFVR